MKSEIIAQDIFKAYDIRGIVNKTLDNGAVENIAKAFASKAIEYQVKTIVVGRDGRLSGPDIAKLLIQNLNQAGINVIDIGMVTTPMLYFAAHELTQGSGIMITGSHNPPDYNGFKLMLAGDTFAGEAIQELYKIILKGDYKTTIHLGSTIKKDISEAYQSKIVKDIHLERPLDIIIDAGNGVAGDYAGALYRALGCTVTELYCQVDGNFPNHHPDPAKPENLTELINALKDSPAEIGLAFDGDGDRLGVVTKNGQIIWPDRLLMLFAADVLNRVPKAKVIYDVKCSRLLAPWIESHGGTPIISKTGHSFIKAAIKENQAELAGEMSGHLFFKERWFGFDDGLYAGARLLEILSHYADPTTVLNDLPNAIATPEISIPMQQEGENHKLIVQLQKQAKFNALRVISIDGLRVEYEDGFGLIRASNTTPVLVLRFEADNQKALIRIKEEFKKVLNSISNYTLD